MAEGIEIYSAFLDRFEARGLEYFITGSVASSAYGEPRFTQDLDLLVSLRKADVSTLIEAFPAELFYVPPAEALRAEVDRDRGGHLKLIHHESGVRADVYVASDDPLEEWALANRRRVALGEGLGFWLAPPEYIIVRKLEWRTEGGGERHESDVRGMLAVLGESLDLDFLGKEIDRRGLRELWRRVRGS